jgi:hypothetical protein
MSDTPHRWPTRVVGVDFSGAADAGRKLWVARGERVGDTLVLDDCRPAERLPGGGRERDRALAAVRAYLLAQGPCAVGLDAPFSLPRLLLDAPSWEAFLHAFAARFPSAEALRGACRARCPGEVKRATEAAARVPFAAYNVRLYRQTYHAIRDVLAPLVAAGRAVALPFQPPHPGVPWLLEVCPAATLKRWGWYRPYKGRLPARAAARAALLDRLAAAGVRLPDGVRQAALADPEGDALDAVLAAWTAARHAGTVTADAAPCPLEGCIYV